MGNPFFGTGYKKKVAPEPNETEITGNVAVNVMGKIYQGNEKIEMIAGEVIVDGVRTGKLPITSGTWIKKLKGKYFQNGSLTIVSKCATMEGVDK